MRIIILLIVYFVMVSGVSYALDPYPVTACLGETGTKWDNVEGEDIWDYESEFPVWAYPNDTYIVEWLRIDKKRRLIILASDSTPNVLYVMPFMTMEIQPDGNIHPCGIFRIESEN